MRTRTTIGTCGGCACAGLVLFLAPHLCPPKAVEALLPRREPQRQQAPIDLTGYWVSIVTEDWRYRMVTPPKGDYASVPLNPAGRRESPTHGTPPRMKLQATHASPMAQPP